MDAAVVETSRRPFITTVTTLAVLLLGALAALSELVQAWMTITGRYLYTSGGAEPRKPVVDLPQLLQAEVREGYTMFLDDVPAALRVLAATPALLAAITYLIASVLLARAIRSIAAGDAFGRRVRSTLTWLSATLLVGGLLQGAVDSAAGAALWSWFPRATDLGGTHELAIAGLGLDVPHWPVMIVVLGLVTSALTVAFQQGARLQEETDGLV
ncbi:DUF2975 domain-containing protein [Oerskovia turbata]|nr:DUF2975 domain-containing protein [Oerskovia turbata]